MDVIFVGGGGVLGSIFGSLVGVFTGNAAAKKAHESIPEESVTLSWQEPKTKKVEIGKIPIDHYEPIGSSCHVETQKPVYIEEPVKDKNGNFEMITKSQTFTEHGKPEVFWKDTDIVCDKKMVDVKQIRNRDYESETVYDHEGNSHTEWRLIGFNVSYEPVIEGTVVGKFKRPNVSFLNPVDQRSIIAGHTIGGAFLGGIGGALLGAAAKVMCFE